MASSSSGKVVVAQALLDPETFGILENIPLYDVWEASLERRKVKDIDEKRTRLWIEHLESIDCQYMNKFVTVGNPKTDGSLHAAILEKLKGPGHRHRIPQIRADVFAIRWADIEAAIRWYHNIDSSDDNLDDADFLPVKGSPKPVTEAQSIRMVDKRQGTESQTEDPPLWNFSMPNRPECLPVRHGKQTRPQRNEILIHSVTAFRRAKKIRTEPRETQLEPRNTKKNHIRGRPKLLKHAPRLSTDYRDIARIEGTKETGTQTGPDIVVLPREFTGQALSELETIKALLQEHARRSERLEKQVSSLIESQNAVKDIKTTLDHIYDICAVPEARMASVASLFDE
ncbi:hypothetical protein H072_9392 [Dactylellina haptotyla CBS 200.50]|uniref:Uncharacterized protein n=1 Tax=Dactylellina haptotyla (strain CBS 200.50) TaxID=1284197 RepID=S8BP98_DACHA|nr:hypothetical protein H072_9392 [Dactylellina haptotyla CBS 200.50]